MTLPNFILFAGALVFVVSLAQAQEEEIPKQLADLKFRYDVEVARVLQPVQRNYIKALKELQQNYVKAGNLEAAIKAREEIARAERWDTLSLESLRGRASSEMGKDQFEAWLLEKQFDVDAKTGPVTVTFEKGGKVNWKLRSKLSEYTYKIVSDREVNIFQGGNAIIKVKFQDDLKGGTLESARGKYDLKISDQK